MRIDQGVHALYLGALLGVGGPGGVDLARNDQQVAVFLQPFGGAEGLDQPGDVLGAVEAGQGQERRLARVR